MLFFLLLTVVTLSSPYGQSHVIVRGPFVERLEGVIRDPSGSVMPGVQIELYNRGELWFDDKRPTSDIRKKQKRLERAFTDKEGRFRFGSYRPGQYEIYCVYPGFNPQSYVVRLVSKKKAEVKELEIIMELAT